MQLAKIHYAADEIGVGVIEGDHIRPLLIDGRFETLADILHTADPVATVYDLLKTSPGPLPLASVTVMAPVDRQEVWAAGVTYRRSKVAREEESAGAAQFYDKVYTAARPELFLKATPDRVSHPGQPIRVRRDSNWSVPEPELTLVVSPALKVVGYTIGNDVSSRDIEGENPLYLPQAKIYAGSCAVGPWVTLAASAPKIAEADIRLVIRRGGAVAFDGHTAVSQMARTLDDLVSWLGRENAFPNGVLLMTGTGIVPPDAFNLSPGDTVDISITGLGTLTNPVE